MCRSFQEVQGISALGAAVRFLPEVVVGISLNLLTGVFVDRIPANHLINGSCLIATASPLIMALIDPAWTYWRAAFWAVLLCPVNADGDKKPPFLIRIREINASLTIYPVPAVIFTVANLIITDAFSENTQALAGGVFNTMAQFGYSVGIMLMAITQTAVTNSSVYEDNASPEALMEGYRAAFWLCFGFQAVACPIGVWGLRKAGRVGLKRD